MDVSRISVKEDCKDPKFGQMQGVENDVSLQGNLQVGRN